MAFDPSKIKTGAEHEPRKVILYGSPKLGKSTLAGSTRDALMIPTEDRVSHIDCAKTDVVSSYDDVMEVFNYLLDGKHSYKRVILDTVDEFEPLLHQKICKKNGWSSLVEDSNKETNFQKGLKYHAVEGWRKFLANCDMLRREAGMDIIFVAHAMTQKVNPPDHDAYDRWAMKVDPNAVPILEGWADIIGFYDKEIFVNKTEKQPMKTGKVISTSKRMLYLDGTSAAMVNCNSYGMANFEVPFEACSDVMEWLLTGGKKNSEGVVEAPATTEKKTKTK